MRTIAFMCVVLLGELTITPLCHGAAAGRRLVGSAVLAFLQRTDSTLPPLFRTLCEGRYRVITSSAVVSVPVGAIYQAEDTQNADEKVTIQMFTHNDNDYFNAMPLLRIIEEDENAAARDLFPRDQRVPCAGNEPQRSSLVMEYIPRTLDTLIADSETVTLTRITVAHQLLRAVDYLHSKNVMHLCLRPEVIGVGSDGNIKVFDFGCAATREDYHTRKAANMMNNLWYISPEAALARDAQKEPELIAKQDLFEVGAILYEMFSGAKLYNREQLEALMSCVHSETLNERLQRVCPVVALAFYYKVFLDEGGSMDQFEKHRLAECPALEKCKEHYDTSELKKKSAETFSDGLKKIANKILSNGAPVADASITLGVDDIFKFFGDMIAYPYKFRSTSANLLNHPLFQRFGLSQKP